MNTTKRQGNAAIYLDTWHADIWSFLHLRAEGGDEYRRTHGLDIANWIPDIFMERVKERGVWSTFSPDEVGDLIELKGPEFNKRYKEYEEIGKNGLLRVFHQHEAYDLWKEMLSQLYETGSSWITFKDPSAMRYMGSTTATVKSSNLCVTGNTRVLTIDGYEEIATLDGITKAAWNGEEWSETAFANTNGSAEVATVITENGSEVETTLYHEWPVMNEGKVTKVETRDLKVGDTLLNFNLPSEALSGDKDLTEPYILGYRALLSNSKTIANVPAETYGDVTDDKGISISKRFVPDASYTLESRIKWLSGLIDGVFSAGYTLESRIEWLSGLVGGVFSAGNANLAPAFKFDTELSPKGLRMNLENKTFLNKLRLMLQELGVHSVIAHQTQASYIVDDFYIFEIGVSGLKKLIALGLDCHTAIMSIGSDFKDTESPVDTIKSISKDGKVVPTYCGTEPKRNMLMFNGVLTHQCTEILEPATEDETAVCTLGSIVLTEHVHKVDGELTVNWSKLSKSVSTLIRALDTTVDYNFYPTERSKNSNNRYRHLGAGIAGYQDMIAMLKIPFDSEESVDFGGELMEFISYHAIKTSIDMAKTLGPFPLYEDSHWAQGKLPQDLYSDFNDYRPVMEFERFSKERLDWQGIRNLLGKYGIRNATLLAIAPTATSSNICMSSPSIEPRYENIYIKQNMSGIFLDVNKVLRDQLDELGLWSNSLAEKIRDNDGIITGISDIPQHIQKLHKTAFEIDPIWLIKNAASKGVWVDQGQSLNLYIRNTTGAKLNDTYMAAWDYGLKTTYYLRSAEADEVVVEDEQGNDIVTLDVTDAPSFCEINADGCAVCQ